MNIIRFQPYSAKFHIVQILLILESTWSLKFSQSHPENVHEEGQELNWNCDSWAGSRVVRDVVEYSELWEEGAEKDSYGDKV